MISLTTIEEKREFLFLDGRLRNTVRTLVQESGGGGWVENPTLFFSPDKTQTADVCPSCGKVSSVSQAYLHADLERLAAIKYPFVFSVRRDCSVCDSFEDKHSAVHDGVVALMGGEIQQAELDLLRDLVVVWLKEEAG